MYAAVNSDNSPGIMVRHLTRTCPGSCKRLQGAQPWMELNQTNSPLVTAPKQATKRAKIEQIHKMSKTKNTVQCSPTGLLFGFLLWRLGECRLNQRYTYTCFVVVLLFSNYNVTEYFNRPCLFLVFHDCGERRSTRLPRSTQEASF